MSYYSDTDRSTRGSNLIEGNSKVTRTHTAKALKAESSGTQAKARVRARSPSRTRTKASEKKPRGVGDSSADYTDGDNDWEPAPRQHHRQRGFPDRRSSRLDSALHTRAPYDRDSGYYGSTSAYPWNPSDNAFHGGYPGYAGPGQLVPTPYTGSIVPQMAPYQNLPGPLAPYVSGPGALPPAGYYGNHRPAMTAQDGAVTVRKTKLPGADEKLGLPGSSSLNDVDVVWNVSSTKDVTLHLELDIEDDIDSNLREFALITRRGDYKRAEQYYQDNLACHSEQPDVVVEYVRMLVEKGSYKTIRDLGIDETGLYHVCRSPTAPKAPQAAQLLLLLHKARSSSEPELQLSFHTALMAVQESLVERFGTDQEEAEEPQPLAPVMIQLFLLFLDLTRTVSGGSNIVIDHSPIRTTLSISLRMTYTDLLSNSRCWEIRDTIIASVRMLGVLGAFSEIFPANSIADAMSRFMADWETMERSDLSDLALLDILNYINGCKDKSESCRLPPLPDVEIAHHTVSDWARIVAASIKHKNPQLMKSRSYLEWLLLEERKERDKTQDPKVKNLTVEAFRSFPGKAISYTNALFYVPADSENPGWPVLASVDSEDKDASFQLLSAARKTAQELGNYKLESECLHELTCRSIEPEKYLTELETLHLSANGAQLSLLKTRLMRYLTVAASDEKTRRLLKSQLLELDPRLQSIWPNFSHPVLEWAYRKVLYALMCSLGEGDTEQAIAVYHQGQAMIPLLPGWIKDSPGPEHHGYFKPMGREQYRGGMGNIPRRTFRSPSPPPPPPPARQWRNRSEVVISTPREGQRFEKERGTRESKELSVKAPAGSERIPTILETEQRNERQKSAPYPPPSETNPSRSKERLRPEPDREYLELKRQLEEHRHKQNEIIRKRAEEERLKELEREVRKRTQEEVHRMYEEKAKMAELAKIERERARAAAEMEMKERLLREEEETSRRKKDEEELRARIKAEIMEESARKERVKEEAMALEAKIRAEARQEVELERKLKKEAAALKRKAKKEQEAKEVEMYLEAEANAREKILAELKAGIPRRRLRAVLLGISDSEGSDFERRLITEGAHSDSDSSVEARRRKERRNNRRSRRCSSSCSSCSNEDRRRGSESTRRVIVQRYRVSPGGSMHRVDVDGVGVAQGDEVAVIEDFTGQDKGGLPSSGPTNSLEKIVDEGQQRVESHRQEGFEESQEVASPPEPEQASDSVLEEKPEVSPKAVNENEEETEGQDEGEGITTGAILEAGQDSRDDLLIPEGAMDDVVADNENDLDIYD